MRVPRIYSHVKEFRYHVSVRGDPRQHLENMCRTFHLPEPYLTPARIWRLRLKKNDVRQLGLQGFGMVLMIDQEHYSIWYRTAKTKRAAEVLVEILNKVPPGIERLKQTAITTVEYYVCVHERHRRRLQNMLPRSTRRVARGLERNGIRTFYGQRFNFPVGVRSTLTADLVLYQPRNTHTPEIVKLELKLTIPKGRKAGLSRSDRRALVLALRQIVEQASVPTLRKPRRWNGLRVRPLGRMGRTARAVVARLKDAPNHLLSFRRVVKQLPHVTRRNLRATVLTMKENGFVVLVRRAGHFRSVRLRMLIPSNGRGSSAGARLRAPSF